MVEAARELEGPHMLPELSIVTAELTSQPSDVAAILYSRNVPRLFYALFAEGILKESQLSPPPATRQSKVLKPLRTCGFGDVLIVGAEDPTDVNYSTLRTFGIDVARGLARHRPTARSVSMILHGPGYGLDIDDAFTQLMNGLLEGLSAVGDTLPRLQHIYVTERSNTRANRLAVLAAKSWRPPVLKRTAPGDAEVARRTPVYVRETVTSRLDSSRAVFVAMPFADDFTDVFELGIYEPIKSLNIKCERSDSTAFVGDIVQRIRERIESASLIVAEVSTPNPNVYLEIGYAWGRNKRVLLVCRETVELNFDVRNHNCIKYRNIVDLKRRIAEYVSQLVDAD